jgi:hypothetical protein
MKKLYRFTIALVLNFFFVSFAYSQSSELPAIMQKYITNANQINCPIILLTEIRPDDPNSANGVRCSTSGFVNISNKTIKYVIFTITPYNKVNDIAYSSIGNESTVKVKYTGFIKPNEFVDYVSWGPIWYNPDIKTIKINEIDIIYDDNTTINIKIQDENLIELQLVDHIEFMYEHVTNKDFFYTKVSDK